MGFNFTFYYVFETIGILAFALSGMILAKHKDFDVVGIYSIACITAFGGGTLRDVILDSHPVYWINHPEYPAIIFFMTFIFAAIKQVELKESYLVIPDTIGLALFTSSGAQLATELHHPMIIVGILSTMVATFGGVLRDTLCRKTPTIFKRNTALYASIAFLGGCLYFILFHYTSLSSWNNVLLTSAFVAFFRIVAIKFKWKLLL